MAERRRGREAALQILYQWEVGRIDIDKVIGGFPQFQRARTSDAALAFAGELARGTVESLETIDPVITAHAANWRFDRLAVIDRLILRLATYELQRRITPPGIIIDEAIELAKRFGGGDSARFVNGVLDAIHRHLQQIDMSGPET
ncbi:MAG: transcription antitermination factor NusB [Acidobacteria bacterium]|nr:transcription antitermination factor NusB [Acidobacteriota bacterium]